MRGTLFIGTEVDEVRKLAEALASEFLAMPCDEAALEEWRAKEGGGARHARVVVAPWREAHAARALCEASPADWLARGEAPIVAFTLALAVGAARCADGGALVAVIEAPAPLDSAGFAPEAGVAEAAIALVRSLARSEGARGVRVNAVTTAARLAPARAGAEAPPLAHFPGANAREVAGAVRLLLADDASGVTGSVLAADCGRSW